MFIDLIVGARPNFIKVAGIIREIKIFNKPKKKIKYRIVHTGQHYSKDLSENFFNELGIEKPHHNLNSGSGTHAVQTSKIMQKYEILLTKKKPLICVVFGDVNSTLACAIVAKKMNIIVAHVEGGLRSFDNSMPEEINRIVTDSICDIFFTTTENAGTNLLNIGKKSSQIFFVGNTMIDTLINFNNKNKKPNIWNKLCLKEKQYYLLTLHRPSNVDNKKKLLEILKKICNSCNNSKIIFPIHPRSSKQINKIGDLPKNLHIINPLSYLKFIYLLKNTKAIMTDSGGITEEATYLNIPCITFRDTTERPETIYSGTNILIGDKYNKLDEHIKNISNGNWKNTIMLKKWDGKTSKRIVKILSKILGKYENTN